MGDGDRSETERKQSSPVHAGPPDDGEVESPARDYQRVSPAGAAEVAPVSLRALCSPAIHHVVVDHADGLHEGIANRGAHEGETALFERLRHRIGLGREGGNLAHRSRPRSVENSAAGELPDVRIERAKFVHRSRETRGRFWSSPRFETIRDHPGIGHQPGVLIGTVLRDFFGIPTLKRAKEVLNLRGRSPRQPGLESLERSTLEQFAVVVNRNSPYFVVISLVDFIADTPPAPNLAISHVMILSSAGLTARSSIFTAIADRMVAASGTLSRGGRMRINQPLGYSPYSSFFRLAGRVSGQQLSSRLEVAGAAFAGTSRCCKTSAFQLKVFPVRREDTACGRATNCPR